MNPLVSLFLCNVCHQIQLLPDGVVMTTTTTTISSVHKYTWSNWQQK